MASRTKSNNAPQHRVNPIDIEDDKLKHFQVPSFVNSTNAWWFGQDIYIDMALLTVDEMLDMASETEVVDIAIYGRYAMSIATFDSFFQRLNELREQLKSAGLIKNEQITS